MLKLFFKILAIFAFLSVSVESKNFNQILVKGNERISAETIKIFSEISEQDFLDENSINLILKKIYKTGYFKNVNIRIEKNILIIEVLENPIIDSIIVKGIKSKSLGRSIKEDLSLKSRSSFNISSVKKDEITIINTLKAKGYYFAVVTTTIEEISDNRINLTYSIDIGNKAKISKITFVGDKKFKDSKLKNVIISEEHRFWKFISGKKYLDEKLINFDKKLLSNFYINKGFFNSNIESSFASYLGNDYFELIYNISAGEKFYFNKINLDLPLDYDSEDFKELNLLFKDLKGEIYSLNSINKILKKIDKIGLNEQYEFLSSTVKESINDNLIDLSFVIKDSEKFYVERINIFGNNHTLESVIRNNLIVDEGDAFNDLLHNRSINNLKGLNYFGVVNSEVINGSSENQKIINIDVTEKPTGEISAGAGVSTTGGTIGFGVSENNFLGRGIKFNSDLTLSKKSAKGLLSLSNPNYKGTNKSLSLSVESTVTDLLKASGYKSNKTGFTVGTGFEYYEDLFLNIGTSTFGEKIETDATATESIKKQKGNYFDTFFNYSINYDKLNQKFQPTDGFLSKFSQNIPLISKSYSLLNTYEYRHYGEWLNENIVSLKFYASARNSLKNKNVKLSERLFIPARKLRGFESGKVGPKDGVDFIGGNYATAINISTTIPQLLPNLQNTNFNIFFDAANVWGVDYSSSLTSGSKIRSSVGIGIDFFTPVGPLNISITEVISKDTTDVTESFRFNLGTSF